MFTASLRHASPAMAMLAPIASSSRSTFVSTSFRSMTAIRRAHAVPASTRSGFEGVPAPAYNGPVEDVKGKQKESPQSASKPAAPRRKIEIKAKKAAISMVSLQPLTKLYQARRVLTILVRHRPHSIVYAHWSPTLPNRNYYV